MTFSRFAKAVTYAVLALVLMIASTVLSMRLHQATLMEETYFQTNLYWFIVAVALLGGGVFCWREYARKDLEHRPDVLFVVIFGAVLLIGWFVMFMQYGGLVAGHFSENAYTAVNLNIIVMWFLPIPLLVRLMILSFSSRIEPTVKRRIVQIITTALIVLFIVFTAAGGTMKMMQYTELETGNTMTIETEE